MPDPAPSPSPDQSPTLNCPRCGYDQAGQAARFIDSCPLHGLCTECGLTFAWADIYYPARRLSKTFEHADRQHFRVWARTIFECLFTPRLFKRLQMHHPINATRLTIYALSLLPLIPLLSVACALINDVFNLSYRAALFDFGSRTQGVWFLNTDYAFASSTPLERLQRVAVPLDVGGYGDGYPFETVLCVLLWTLLTPTCYPVLRQTLRRIKVRTVHLVRSGVYALTGVVAVIGVQLVFDWFLEWNNSLSFSAPKFMNALTALSENGWLIVGLLLLWQLWFWSWAGHRYLKLPRAVPVALAMTVIGGLLAAALCTLTFGWSVLLRVVPV